ncbi:MAG: hypothetical protein JXA69_00790 [Phycisphaerae bacterium]|nr:hypothetical protein [Phycisphaerae bacterium]
MRTRVAVTAAIAASLILVVTSWHGAGERSANVAFAQVLSYLRSPENVTFRVTLEGKDRTSQSICMIRGNVTRIENLETKAVTISDPTKTLVLLPDKGKAVFLTREQRQADADEQDPSSHDTSVQAWIDRLAELRETAEAYLGEQELEGRLAAVFVTTDQGAEWTIWADRETARPIRVEVVMPFFKAKAIYHDFAFDVELAPELFSFTPPAGYTLVEGKMGEPVVLDSRDGQGKATEGVVTWTSPQPVETDFSEPSEKDVVEWLRMLVEANDGVFPDMYRAAEIDRSWQPRTPQDVTNDPEVLSRLMKKMRAAQFLKKQLKGTSTGRPSFMFIGQGDVKLGDANEPVFFWEHGEPVRYRVVFGDLSIRDMTQEEWELKLVPKIIERGSKRPPEE